MANRTVLSPCNRKEVEEWRGWVPEAGSATWGSWRGPHIQALCLLVQQSLGCCHFFPRHEPFVRGTSFKKKSNPSSLMLDSYLLSTSCPGRSFICLLVLERQTSWQALQHCPQGANNKWIWWELLASVTCTRLLCKTLPAEREGYTFRIRHLKECGQDILMGTNGFSPSCSGIGWQMTSGSVPQKDRCMKLSWLQSASWPRVGLLQPWKY